MSWQARVPELLRRFEQLTAALSDPAIIADRQRYRELAREHAELVPTVELAQRLDRLQSQRAEVESVIAAGEDAELVELAEAELPELRAEEDRLSLELRHRLLPKDPLADRSAVVEIRAGTGGDEAGLFAGDLFRMYRRYAERRGWDIDLVSVSEGERGSIKEAIFTVRGANAYGDLRHESGVHRVQRVPATESAGRIHTSAATVAVLPEAQEVDIEIRDEDLRIDVYRSSGPGGQSVNTTDSAVRITHVPTGVVVTCQDEKSQHKNKAKALKVLRSRLLDAKIAKQEAERARARKIQVGTGDRSAKIRTYNFPQSRVTDHRIGLTLHTLQGIVNGDLDDVITALKQAQEAEDLELPPGA
ncbi:MAG: peptide chain release factor 1 [Longimicrobiales bacterium]